MGKSLGNTLDPAALVAGYGPDAVRLFLLKEVAFGCVVLHAGAVLCVLCSCRPPYTHSHTRTTTTIIPPTKHKYKTPTTNSQDGNFSEREFRDVVNAALANNLGNCLNRTLGLLHKYLDGESEGDVVLRVVSRRGASFFARLLLLTHADTHPKQNQTKKTKKQKARCPPARSTRSACG